MVPSGISDTFLVYCDPQLFGCHWPMRCDIIDKRLGFIINLILSSLPSFCIMSLGGMKVIFSLGSRLLASPIWCGTDRGNDCTNLWQESCVVLLWVLPFVLRSHKEQAFTLLSACHFWCCFNFFILPKDFQHFEHLKSLLVLWLVLRLFRFYEDWNDLWPSGLVLRCALRFPPLRKHFWHEVQT